MKLYGYLAIHTQLMKKLSIFLLAITLLTGCNKLKEKIIEDQIMKAMIDGQWVVTEFTFNSTDITADFTGYKFKYYKTKKVDAILNGTLDRTGDWDGDASNMTTWAISREPLLRCPTSMVPGASPTVAGTM